MQPQTVDGKKIAAEIIENLKKLPKPDGFIAVFLNIRDAAAESFVKQKMRTANELGLEVRQYEVFDADTNDSLRKRVRIVAQGKRCGGVVLQLPLPSACDVSYVANTIPPAKDIDCLGARNLGALLQHKGNILPPAARTLHHILKSKNKNIQDFDSIAIIGQGILVGKPISAWLLGNHPNIHAYDKGFIKEEVKKNNLVILGTGQAGILNGADIKAGAWVIDFGYGFLNEKITGDFDSTTGSIDHVGLYTPTPGGTGPILVASLFENLYAQSIDN